MGHTASFDSTCPTDERQTGLTAGQHLLLLTELPLNRKHVEKTLPGPLSIRCMTAIPSPEDGKQTSMRVVEISTSNNQDAWSDQGVSGDGIAWGISLPKFLRSTWLHLGEVQHRSSTLIIAEMSWIIGSAIVGPVSSVVLES